MTGLSPGHIGPRFVADAPTVRSEVVYPRGMLPGGFRTSIRPRGVWPFVSLCVLVWTAILLATPPALAQTKGDRGGGGGGGGKGDESGQQGGDDNDDSEAEARKAKGKEEDEVEIKIVPTPLDYLETPCIEERDAAKCLQAGLLWKEGVEGFKKGKPDYGRAENYLRTGCYFGSAVSCVHAGNMFLKAEAGILLEADGTISLDFVMAVDLFDKGCALGALQACAMAGDLKFDPDAMLPNDQSGYLDHLFSADQISARQYYEIGCPAVWLPGGLLREQMPDGQFPVVDAYCCSRMGEFFARGITMRPVASKGADYMELACFMDDTEETCDRAEALREAAMEEEARKRATKKEPYNPDADFVGQTTGRGTGAQASARPDVSRFDDPGLGVEGEESIVRFEFEIPIGVRWIYGPGGQPLFVLGLGLDWWFALAGVSVEFTYSTDDLLRRPARDYGRIQVAVVGKLAIPVPIRLSIPARLIIIPGVGGAFGNRLLGNTGTPALMGAIVERIEVRLQSPQRDGPRQWGGIRFEQQQSFVQYTFGAVEHASQLTAVLGFTFGGVGPEIPRKKERLEDE